MENNAKMILAFVALLVLAGAVMVIPPIMGIGRAGQFNGFDSAGLEQKCAAYWQGASPFSIHDMRIDGQKATFEMENRISIKLSLQKITFDGSDLGISAMDFEPGENRSVASNGYAPPCASPGDEYQIADVVFTYSVGGISDQIQRGKMPIYGKCA